MQIINSFKKKIKSKLEKQNLCMKVCPFFINIFCKMTYGPKDQIKLYKLDDHST